MTTRGVHTGSVRATESADTRRQMLCWVLAINTTMFGVGLTGGWLACSVALMGDALDMMSDASVCAITLFALNRSRRTRAGVALLKGVSMAVLGLLVIAGSVRNASLGTVPDAQLMGVLAALALAANVACLLLLVRHRGDDINMRSAWLCSRNDCFASFSVLSAAMLVQSFGVAWPDLVVGLAIALLFMHSAHEVINTAWREWRTAPRGQAYG